jgi:hypothetical protein
LWQQRQKLDQLNVETKVVTFDADFMAKAYVANIKMTWPLLLDPEQTLYDAYGMRRGSWWAIYGLPSIWNYLKLIFRGRLPGKPGKDWRQLGGDVLIDPNGIIRLHHISTGPHDRPSVDSILEQVEKSS